MRPRRFFQLLGVTLLVMSLNVAVSFLWVAVYSHLVNPGHDLAFYQSYAQVAAPYSSVLAGIPLVYAFGRWVARWGYREAPMKHAMVLWLTYVTLDVIIMVAAGAAGRLAAIAVVSIATKGLAAFAAGRAEFRLSTAAVA